MSQPWIDDSAGAMIAWLSRSIFDLTFQRSSDPLRPVTVGWTDAEGVVCHWHCASFHQAVVMAMRNLPAPYWFERACGSWRMGRGAESGRGILKTMSMGTSQTVRFTLDDIPRGVDASFWVPKLWEANKVQFEPEGVSRNTVYDAQLRNYLEEVSK